MPTISKLVLDVPIGELCLKYALYNRLRKMGVETIGDLVQLPDAVLRPHMDVFLEGIERIKRDHAALTD